MFIFDPLNMKKSPNFSKKKEDCSTPLVLTKEVRSLVCSKEGYLIFTV